MKLGTRGCLAFKGPAQSPTFGDALNAGYLYLEVRCLGCDTHQTVALDVLRRPKATPIHERLSATCVQGLFASEGLSVQTKPFGSPANAEDFCERSAVYVVAGRTVMFVYTAYLDESGTHDGSPITVMGGVLARAEQWRDFEKKFAAVQSKYGFRVWHTKTFKRKAGDFQGWTDEMCHELYWSLRDVTSYSLTDVVALTLNNASFEADYKFGEVPRKARLDTKYGLCFRFCLAHCVREVVKRKRRNRVPPLHVVLEGGHANFGDAERIFLEEQKLWVHEGVPILRTLTKPIRMNAGSS